VSMNVFIVFYRDNGKLKIRMKDSIQDTESLIVELKSKRIRCFYEELDYELLVHFSSEVQLVDRSEYDYTRNLFGEL
jgi:hypothetical protein